MEKAATRRGKALPKSRHLNIIYFFDSKRTHSLKIPSTIFHIILTFVLMILIWTGVSAFLIYREGEEVSKLRAQLRDSVATIFDYQSKYDDIYDIAYAAPKKEIEPTASATRQVTRTPVKPPAPAQLPMEATISEPTPITRSTAPVANPSVPNVPAQAGPPKLHVTTDTVNWPVVVEAPTLVKQGDELKLNLSIRNQATPKKAEGYIWAIIILKSKDGKELKLSDPISILAQNNMENSKKATYYNIRYYKSKSFSFALPKGWDGWIEKINIQMMNQDDKIASYQIYDTNGRIALGELKKYASQPGMHAVGSEVEE